MLVGDDEFGEYLPVGFVINRKLREKIALILVHASKPVGVRHLFDPRDLQQPLFVRNRQRLDDGNFIYDDQAVGAGNLQPLIEGAAHYR